MTVPLTEEKCALEFVYLLIINSISICPTLIVEFEQRSEEKGL